MEKNRRQRRGRRFMALAIASVAVLVATAAPAFAGFTDDEGDASDWLGSLYGKWRLSSVVVDGTQ